MKRLVALLSCICVLLAVCGTAGALELPYVDRSSIRNPDAVSMLTDLGLLEGDGGRFFPEGTPDNLNNKRMKEIETGQNT